MHDHKPELRANPNVPLSPEVPLTMEGSFLLHQMMHFDRAGWNTLSAGTRDEIAGEAAAVLREMEAGGQYQSAAFSLLGHKGDLLFIHFRESLNNLNAAELRLSGLRLAEFLEPATSYLSVVELGLYESTARLYASLQEKGIEPGSAEWTKAVEETLERQRAAMAPRLYPAIPESQYICFYPMDRTRGESKNWYLEPLAERQRMMKEHGLVGRRYAGAVKQIISGSVGFDDWEWGVDLFADDPVVFKKLIYEMRFDEVSASYAQFGQFFTGIRVPAGQFAALLDGQAPRSRS